MNASIFLALIAIAAPSIALAAELQPSVVVTPLVAEFSLPVAHEGPWRWARAETWDNALEYEWELDVKSRGGEYQFGFSFYKYPGSKERTGSLAELLKSGQASLWKMNPEGAGSLVEGARVSATAVDGGIVVRLSDPTHLRMLFGDRPPVAKFVTRTPDGSRDVHEVSIEYRN